MALNVVDLHREVSLSLLRSTYGYAVKTPKGQKEPGHYRWDPKSNTKQESEKTIYSLERSDDNLGVHLHGRVIDVDVDTDNPILMAALDFFLPPTHHIWGRPSRPRTHRLYELTGPNDNPYDPSSYPFLAALSKKGMEQIQLEVRGGAVKNGEYSLLPGSVHPSGERYEWHDVSSARSTPVAVDMHRVINGVRFACVAALIVPYWIEGQRNQLCMAVSGFFHRAAAHVNDMGAMSELYFDKDMAKNLLEGIIRVSGDDESDYGMRMRTFEQTWEKAEKGEAVQGATSIVKMTGDENMLSMLYSLLVDSPDLREFDEFMDRYAVRNGTSNVIDRVKAGSKGAVSIMTVSDFRNSNMHRTIQTGNGDIRSMVNMLLASKRTIRVDGLAFIPGAPDMIDRDDGKYINQWRGFGIPPYDGPVKDEDVSVFLNYVRRILADGNEFMYEWILAWCADIFKCPARKPGTALVLVGKPGSGKSFLGARILRRIIGRNHSMQTNTVDSLMNHFNMDSSNVLLVQCDEALNSRRHADANKLKSMITDPTKRVEPKGINAYEIEDFARYMFTSNNINDAVAIVDGQDDRRYTVQHVNEDFATKSPLPETMKNEYWDSLHDWTDSDENLSKVHRWLLDYDYDPKLIRKPVDTKARRNIQQHSQRGFDDWLMQICSYDNPFENMSIRDHRIQESFSRKGTKYVPSLYGWPDLVAYKRLEDSYELYRKKKGMMGTTPSFNVQQIKTEFMARGFFNGEPLSTRVDIDMEVYQNGRSEKIRQKIRVTQMPSKEAILMFLKAKYGYEPIEDKDDDIDLGQKDHKEDRESDKGPRY